MSEREKAVLSQAIRAEGLRDGSYAAVVAGADVRQPVVSLALHRRLVMRTDAVDRLFKYLRISGECHEQVSDHGDPTPELRARVEALVGLLDPLRDGSEDVDERLANLLAALAQFANRD